MAAIGEPYGASLVAVTDEDLWTVYLALWRRAEAEGAWVRYFGADHGGRAGWFHSRQDPRRAKQLRPEITIVRPYYIPPMNQPSRERQAGHPPPSLHEELTTLAHEYGHFSSYRGRTPPDEYERYFAAQVKRDELGINNRDAVMLGLNDEERERIMREETLAWVIGREVLTELGAIDFALYDDRTKRGLHNHRYRLGIDELLLDD
jgi:hypothetical protein